MSRQIGNQHAVTVMGKKARLQTPICVVVAATMDKDQRRLVLGKILSTGMGKHRASVDVQFHDRRPIFARRAAPV